MKLNQDIKLKYIDKKLFSFQIISLLRQITSIVIIWFCLILQNKIDTQIRIKASIEKSSKSFR